MKTQEAHEQPSDAADQDKNKGRETELRSHPVPSEPSPETLTDCRTLYLEYGGRDFARIEAEMRKQGHRFYRQVLYSRRGRDGTLRPGWPEKYGWKAELKSRSERRTAKGGSNVKLQKAKIGVDPFPTWLKAEKPEWTWNWKYQRYLYRDLDEVTTGRSQRLMVFMPPRHGKSEMVTIRYVAWRLLREPGLNVILASHTQRLAERFSSKVKRIIRSSQDDRRRNAGTPARSCGSWKAIGAIEGSNTDGQAGKGARVPTRLLDTAAEWETPFGGLVKAVGVGTAVAGFGAGLIVIDDPVKSRAEAESEHYRQRVSDWFNDDIYTRLEPKGQIILIQTRWHEDDLAGRLIKEMEDGGERWDIVSLPALSESPASVGGTTAMPEATFPIDPNLDLAAAYRPPAHAGGSDMDPLGRKPGRALCPARYDEKALERLKRKLGSYSFSALYQQRPVPIEGGRFKREWFKRIVDRAPDGLRWKRGYDLAVSTKTSADYTASFRCAKDPEGNLYIADGFRKRIEYPEQRRYAIERMRTEQRTEHGIESALHGAAFVQDLRREARVGHIALRSVSVDADKLTRALAWLNLAEEGKVILVRGPWIDEFLDEVCRFPTGRYDDQVDAVSIAVGMLAQPREFVGGF